MNVLGRADQVCNPGGEPLKLPFSPKWADPEYAKEIMREGGFAEDHIKISQEVSYFRAKDYDELTVLLTELFSNLMKGGAGFDSDEAKQAFISKLSGYVLDDVHYIKDENGVAIKMLANIAICTK